MPHIFLVMTLIGAGAGVFVLLHIARTARLDRRRANEDR